MDENPRLGGGPEELRAMASACGERTVKVTCHGGGVGVACAGGSGTTTPIPIVWLVFDMV